MFFLQFLDHLSRLAYICSYFLGCTSSDDATRTRYRRGTYLIFTVLLFRPAKPFELSEGSMVGLEGVEPPAYGLGKQGPVLIGMEVFGP